MKRTKPILCDAGDLRLEEEQFNPSSFGPNEVWVKTTVSALKIGTDRGNYEEAKCVPGAPQYPRRLRDSNFGIVQVEACEMDVRCEKHMINVLLDWSDHQG